MTYLKVIFSYVISISSVEYTQSALHVYKNIADPIVIKKGGKNKDRIISNDLHI